MTRHYPDLGRASDWLKEKFQKQLVSQTSFAGETVGGVAKCLFSQANGKLEYRHLHKISNKL